MVTTEHRVYELIGIFKILVSCNQFYDLRTLCFESKRDGVEYF